MVCLEIVRKLFQTKGLVSDTLCPRSLGPDGRMLDQGVWIFCSCQQGAIKTIGRIKY